MKLSDALAASKYGSAARFGGENVEPAEAKVVKTTTTGSVVIEVTDCQGRPRKPAEALEFIDWEPWSPQTGLEALARIED